MTDAVADEPMCDWGWLDAALARREERRQAARSAAAESRSGGPHPPMRGRMPGWWMQATCRACGAQLAHQAGGTTDGFESQAKLQCPQCRAGYLLRAELVSIDHLTRAEASVDPGRRGGG